MVKIVCWNVNSIGARIENFIKFVNEEAPDIILLQELKCIEERFPREIIDEFSFNVALNCQKARNGVAILSKYPIEDIITDLPENPDIEQARYIEAVVTVEGKVLRVASVYVPNGQEVGHEKFWYKLKFFDSLRGRLEELINFEEVIVIGGDYNVAPERNDVFSPTTSEGKLCFNIEERKKFRELVNVGFYDAYRALNPDKQEFTWWDYRAGAWQYNKGLRLDHLLMSPKAVDKLREVMIHSKVRGWDRPSDHAPVICELDL
jgi:exodeoxyribonuclease-3